MYLFRQLSCIHHEKLADNCSRIFESVNTSGTISREAAQSVVTVDQRYVYPELSKE